MRRAGEVHICGLQRVEVAGGPEQVLSDRPEVCASDRIVGADPDFERPAVWPLMSELAGQSERADVVVGCATQRCRPLERSQSVRVPDGVELTHDRVLELLGVAQLDGPRRYSRRRDGYRRAKKTAEVQLPPYVYKRACVCRAAALVSLGRVVAEASGGTASVATRRQSQAQFASRPSIVRWSFRKPFGR